MNLFMRRVLPLVFALLRTTASWAAASCCARTLRLLWCHPRVSLNYLDLSLGRHSLAENHHAGGIGPPEPRESPPVQRAPTLLRCRKQCNYAIAAGRSTLARDVPSSNSNLFVLSLEQPLTGAKRLTLAVRRNFNACIVISSGSRGR